MSFLWPFGPCRQTLVSTTSDDVPLDLPFWIGTVHVVNAEMCPEACRHLAGPDRSVVGLSACVNDQRS